MGNFSLYMQWIFLNMLAQGLTLTDPGKGSPETSGRMLNPESEPDINKQPGGKQCGSE